MAVLAAPLTDERAKANAVSVDNTTQQMTSAGIGVLPAPPNVVTVVGAGTHVHTFVL